MVATRRKTRRASTPLSSPPPSPFPSQPASRASSPAYTDEQSDSCYGGDRGFNADSDFDSETDSDHESESDSNHEERCNLHSTSLATHCNGRTYANKRCSRKAHVFDEGRLPVCRSHRWWGQFGKAGRCQATAACGYVCNRLAPHVGGYNFCDEHQKGTESLPCYITRLPTELRLMIFRYLLPDTIKASRTYRHNDDHAHTAVLFVNRQFYEEAALLIYSDPKFEVRIWPTYIELFGRRWDRESICYIPKKPSEKLCQAGARRIRHLDVQINFALLQHKVKGGTGLSYEEFELYQVRDTVRKLVEILSPSPSNSGSMALKRLSVTPAPSCRQRWLSDEATAAIFFVLEPFLSLRPIGRVALQAPPRPTLYTWRERNFVSVIGDLHKDDNYRECRNQWTGLMTFGAEPPKSNRQLNEAAALAVAYKKIEDFVRLIYKQDAVEFTGSLVKHAWTSSIFQGIERVLHIARVAYEDGDIESLKKIHEAILKRWVTAHQQQLQSLSAVAGSVSAMFDGDNATHHGGHPEAFDFGSIDSVEHKQASDDKWPELQLKPTIPKFRAPGVTFEEKRMKIIIIKDGERKEWPKTPAVVRQLRAYKQSNP
ncbi:hypothetical protein BU25DRAFT_468200 [Macroventuria anomochaeta]|uniref:Uncharacterized protein n=1 Tax=Macroventuria anomochaeta TaxID=301207 RepID=A0ACB6S3L7_9PLEO|nr:uncharacterized protein BU25DRAFT_468200 [Macroventuria anomochaeta]KAF2627989.1 hypothetical protein BU25DRAFT_468200 [Macroventuria anomochaeta]